MLAVLWSMIHARTCMSNHSTLAFVGDGRQRKPSDPVLPESEFWWTSHRKISPYQNDWQGQFCQSKIGKTCAHRTRGKYFYVHFINQCITLLLSVQVVSISQKLPGTLDICHLLCIYSVNFRGFHLTSVWMPSSEMSNMSVDFCWRCRRNELHVPTIIKSVKTTLGQSGRHS